MKKNYFLLFALIIGEAAYSQVGVNTATPNATFDVTAIPADLSKTDGFIAPRLKGAELKAKDANYTLLQTGAIVYVTEILAPADTTAKTINVTALGYFYFDGNIWQKMTVDLRVVGSSHITQDAGIGSNGTSVGTGTNNIALGKDVLKSNTTGTDNIGIGASALQSNTSGNGNLVISTESSQFSDGSGGNNTTGSYNIVLGGSALAQNTAGEYNLAIGGAALNSNTTGNYNTAIGGIWTLGQNTTGILNVAVGAEALTSQIIGTGNVGIGANALANFIGDANSFGNIGLGYNPGNNLRSGSDNILIGRNAEAKVSQTGSNQLNIGNWIFGDNGKIGLGTAFIPTNTLHVKGGTTNPIRFEGLKAGTSADKIVVVDATGILKTITTASLSAADFDFSSLPSYDSDSLAAAGGLASGKLYKTTTGEIRIKL
ncbi:hypothetical protein A0O34_00465 [Chryseobacterium glaciei]|uniref:Uncharacterized protein n=1 Tax=Chryseobacterium glaciei TaxID=1685010 RepID=A0A172XQ29_9FLAO|nr:hypothetical protein [Chryseobacterium glaciei]ANF49119.1 hypothetical protein A0O34_00465 [Chryseobacterium glaciei]